MNPGNHSGYSLAVTKAFHLNHSFEMLPCRCTHDIFKAEQLLFPVLWTGKKGRNAGRECNLPLNVESGVVHIVRSGAALRESECFLDFSSRLTTISNSKQGH